MRIETEKWIVEQKLILKSVPPQALMMPEESSQASHPTLDVETVWFARYTGLAWPDPGEVLELVKRVRHRDPSNRILVTGFPKMGDRVFDAEIV